MVDECQCVLRRETDDQSVCYAESDGGNLCGKPEGHDGPHAACNVVEHPMEVWGGDR